MRIFFRLAASAAVVAALALPALAGEIASSVDASKLPKDKATALGLYLTPGDAHAALLADPGIVFLDVRDPIEVAFVGHPEGADANVPVKLATTRLNEKGDKYRMAPNKDFLAQVEAVMAREGKGKADPVFVMCRSGGRSADAAKLLIEAGYTNVWNLVEGFEGDMDKEKGQRVKNGWKNAGLPWTYKIDPKTAWQSAD